MFICITTMQKCSSRALQIMTFLMMIHCYNTYRQLVICRIHTHTFTYTNIIHIYWIIWFIDYYSIVFTFILLEYVFTREKLYYIAVFYTLCSFAKHFCFGIVVCILITSHRCDCHDLIDSRIWIYICIYIM